MKKYIAIIKYLFFPFLMSQAADSDFTKIIGNTQVITAKAEDFNNYWIGTNDGLWIINKHNAKVQHIAGASSILPSNHVTAICVTPDENVYVSTDKGMMRYDGYSYLPVSTENTKLPTDNITSMVCDNAGNLWIGTNKGLVTMSNYKCRTFNSYNSILTDNAVKTITKDDNGNISVALKNQDVVKVTDQGMQIEEHVNPEFNAVAKKN